MVCVGVSIDDELVITACVREWSQCPSCSHCVIPHSPFYPVLYYVLLNCNFVTTLGAAGRRSYFDQAAPCTMYTNVKEICFDIIVYICMLI